MIRIIHRFDGPASLPPKVRFFIHKAYLVYAIYMQNSRLSCLICCSTIGSFIQGNMLKCLRIVCEGNLLLKQMKIIVIGVCDYS